MQTSHHTMKVHSHQPPLRAIPDVYLCQVSPEVSCGACCGLYNVATPSLEAIETMLVRRTRWFADVPRTVAGIDAFRARVETAEPGVRPFPDFHHCVFLGMIEDHGRRVGCLLHPLAKGNDGLDWRGLSFYGGMACRTYFCPSVRQLPSRWLQALRQSMDHWYLHGLIVTERQLLAAFFQAVEQRLGRRIHPSDFSANEHATQGLKKLAQLKVDWPFRRPEAAGVCNYFFEDGLYRRPKVEPVDGQAAASPAAVILRELDSVFATISERQRAEQILESLFEQITRGLAKDKPHRK